SLCSSSMSGREMSTVSKSEPPGYFALRGHNRGRVGRRTQKSRPTKSPAPPAHPHSHAPDITPLSRNFHVGFLRSSLDGDRADMFAATVRQRRLGKCGELDPE